MGHRFGTLHNRVGLVKEVHELVHRRGIVEDTSQKDQHPYDVQVSPHLHQPQMPQHKLLTLL